MKRPVRPTWGAAQEAALERARQAPAAPPDDGPRLTRQQVGQRERRAREDARNPPSAEVLERRAIKAKYRARRAEQQTDAGRPRQEDATCE